MTEREFNRGVDMNNSSLGFLTYKDFVNYQLVNINNTNEYTIETLEFFKNQILPVSNLMDKESTTQFRASGFAFNSNGRIVLFNDH